MLDVPNDILGTSSGMGVGCCRCGADDPDDVPVPSGGGCVDCDCCGGGCGEIPDDISGSSELLDDEEEEEEEEELRFVVAIGLCVRFSS